MFARLVSPRCGWIAASLLLLSPFSFAQAPRGPLPLPSPLQDKNFYLLSLLQRDPAARTALATSDQLATISAERQRFTAAARNRCKDDSACLLKSFLWTEEEIDATSFALSALYKNSPALQHLVDGPLRTSGAYQAYASQNGADLFADAWRLCAIGINHILSVYGEGQPPRYPLIDSISIRLNTPELQQHLTDAIDRSSTNNTDSFFEPSLSLALELLTLNHRDEAARLEPMETSANQPAIQYIVDTRWHNFPYSVIVVPGAGPSDPDTPLSPAGRKRSELAAEAWHSGKAPFILLSGGYVHPSQTRFAEALEMKKALLNDFHVPESAILVDPHARHTTTNMRNAAREIYRYGIPADKPALVISDAAQVGYIAGQPFADRCVKELGYLPYRIISRPSDTSLVFLPELDSLQQDPIDPLDP